MTEQAAHTYDIFVSYAAADRAWVWGWLLPRLKDAGLKVCTDRDFDVGVPQVANIQRAVEGSRHALLVLSPAWMDSQWRLFEGMLTITADPAARLRKLLPLALAPCQPPEHIVHLSYADFTDETGREDQLRRVIAAVRGELSLPEIGPQLTRLGSVPSAPFLVPFPHNPDFVGRDEDLAQLHDMIAGGGSPVGIHPTVLVGLGGIGKTQLAVEYAHARRGDYPGGIYWLNAVNPLLGELAHMADQLGLAGHDTPRDQAVQAVWEYLDARPDALVVFDNVVEPATLNLPVGRDLVPANLRCRTLFTTRQRDFPRNFQSFEVKVLPERAAMRLLLRARPEVLEEHHPEWGQARVLCAYLGWLPLALELAAAYLGAYGEVSVAGYLERLRVEGRLTTIDDTEVTAAELPTRYHEIAALVSQDMAAQHRIAVQATLETQWRRLDDEASRLLFRAAGQFPEASWIPITRLGVLTGVAAAAGPGRPSPLSQALRKLHAISLIEELSGEQLRLHPLVREFAAGLGDDALRREMVAHLLGTYEDFASLEAQVADRGIDPVIDDLRMGLALCRDSRHETTPRTNKLWTFLRNPLKRKIPNPNRSEHTSGRLREIERPLDREAHVLRGWDTDAGSSLFAQQILKCAVELGSAKVAASARGRLVALGQPYLALRWRASSESQMLERTLTGHSKWVTAVAATPDGRQAISASSDGTLKVWDIATGQEERTLCGHAYGELAVAVTPDGRRAISASEDNTLKVWDLATGQHERTLRGHSDWVCHAIATEGSAMAPKINAVAAIGPDGRRAISASDDCTLKIWNLATGQEEHTLGGHGGRVRAVAVTPDGRQAISASEDHTLKVWNLQTGREERTLSGHSDSVKAVAVTPDGRRAISASADCTLKVWDLTSGREERTLNGHDASIDSLAVTPDGRQAVSAKDNTLKVWDLVTGQEERTLHGHRGRVLAVAVTPDGRRAITASADCTLKVWDISPPLNAGIKTDREERIHSGHGGRVRAVAVTPDGRRAISASTDDTLKVWDVATGQEERTLCGHSWMMTSVAVTPDGRRAISASADNTLKVWDVATGQEERTLCGHSQTVTAVTVTPDGRRAISVSEEGTLKVWDLDTGQEERTLCGPTHATFGKRAVAVTLDGRRALLALDDLTLKVWDIASGQEERTLGRHDFDVTAVAVTPDGRRAISASQEGTLKIWDIATGREERTLCGHAYGELAVAVTPDGRRAISASEEGTLKIWDIATGREERTLRHGNRVKTVAVTSDGRRAISVSADDTLKVWDIETGRELAAIHLEGSSPCMAVAPDGVTIMVGDDTRNVYCLRYVEPGAP